MPTYATHYFTFSLHLSSRLQEHTNPTILMDTKQWKAILSLSQFLMSCLFYSDHTVQHVSIIIKIIVIVPYAIVSQTNQGHTEKRKGLLSLLYRTSPR